MAFIAKTAFEVKVPPVAHDFGGNVPGYFKSSGDYADCSAGFLCVKDALTGSEGYSAYSILNGNTWDFVACANGNSSGRYGDHTGIYAFNCYNVNQVADGDNLYPVGARTLGLGLPAGRRGDFTELVVGHTYKFGAGNFTAVPGSGEIYCTIANGLLTASSSAPTAGDGYYGVIEKTEHFTEGASDWGTGYIVRIERTVEVNPGP